MQSPLPRYLVGIDLGTTHTVVAYCDAQHPQHSLQIFEIMQLVAPGEVSARPLLPSARYHPAEGELSEADTRFIESGGAVVGEAARLLGAKTQGRLVTSAKSWLSHPSVDPGADILPWGSAEDIVKVSPLHAGAGYLAHVRSVWNRQFLDAPLERQDLVITVPASFDEAARSLTLEASRIAGLPDVRLLEEPQAVVYDWLQRHQDDLKEALTGVRLLLVCDVGGGTTDLTLIKVEPGESPKLTRIGVGDHLMLGGDNVDLALAHLAEQRLIGGERKLSVGDLSQLLEQCRLAKEKLLGEDAPESYKVTLLGGGSKLIGGTRSVALSRDEVRAVALDGFFPLSGLDDLPDRKRSGVIEFGLPYAAEPAVSKHIAAFLKLHRQAAQQASGDESGVPDALLLNGGVFRSASLSGRVAELLSVWRGRPITRLENVHPELAVAYGAVSYALARRNKKLKIGGGSARSYFLLIDTEQAEIKRGLCILPRGSEEGDEIILKDRQFALRLGQPVRFHLVSLTGDTAYKPGDIAVIDEDFHSLPPLAAALGGDNGTTHRQATVQLAATLTEVGTLQLQCISTEDGTQRWDVEFQIRSSSRSVSADGAELPPKFDAAAAALEQVFGKKTRDVAPQAVKTLRSDLEKLLGPRDAWRTSTLRALFAVLLDNVKNRRRSEAHERIWLGLTGYCLRPGYGYPLDDWRIEQLWNIYAQGIQFVNETSNWAEWWTLWRRVAGGLDNAAQQRIFSDLAKYLNPASARQGNIAKQAKQRSYDDMMRLAAVLEHLPPEDKKLLGGWLLQRLQKPGESSQNWWAIGRIGARMPLHGGAHQVLTPEIVAPWLEQTLAADWKKNPQAGFAAMLMARMSGDRVRDIDVALRNRISEKLKASKAPAAWLQLVEAVKELDEKEERQIFGETLPPGLKLL